MELTMKIKDYQAARLNNTGFSFKSSMAFFSICCFVSFQKLEKLGGHLADSIGSCTHLITNKVTRTVKFLSGVSVCRFIITPMWIDESYKSRWFLGKVHGRINFITTYQMLVVTCMYVHSNTISQLLLLGIIKHLMWFAAHPLCALGLMHKYTCSLALYAINVSTT